MEAFWEMGFWVWAVALFATALFLGWYVNWRGALTSVEIERYQGWPARRPKRHDNYQEVPRGGRWPRIRDVEPREGRTRGTRPGDGHHDTGICAAPEVHQRLHASAFRERRPSSHLCTKDRWLCRRLEHQPGPRLAYRRLHAIPKPTGRLLPGCRLSSRLARPWRKSRCLPRPEGKSNHENHANTRRVLRQSAGL